MQNNTFKSAVHILLSGTSIMDRLKTRRAVILERIARGGGATRWYCCCTDNDLQILEEKLTPGSSVSFYFDDRIEDSHYSSEVKKNVEKIILKKGEAIIGYLCDDHLNIEVEIISGLKELSEFVSTLNPSQRIFYGEFPARDNDSNQAVTVILPDADGIVRSHPH